MKSLQIADRFLRLFYFFFILNICLAIFLQFPKQYDSSFLWFINLILPVWASISLGSILGLLIFLFPHPEMSTFMRLIRSQVIGTMVVTYLIFILYLYNIMVFFSVPK